MNGQGKRPTGLELMGVINMYWSHTNRGTYIEWLEKTGFTIPWIQFVQEGNGGHALMLARKNGKH